MNLTTKNTFERAIVESLVQYGEYLQGNAADYSPELGMFKYDVMHFYKKPNQRLERKYCNSC
ncbi:MAG: hypothetical protein PHX48_05360 [Bacteroidales bacterium]|nr:hypothetical protein [Bacteroidales bacterium]